MTKAPKDTQDGGAPADPAVAAAPSPDAGDVSSGPADATTGPPPTDPVGLTPEQVSAAADRAIEKWVGSHLFNTPVSRATPALNFLREQALPALVPLIVKELFDGSV